MTALEWRALDLTSDPHEPTFGGDPAELHDAFEDLLALLQRPAWHAQAACRGQGTKAWFPRRGESRREALTACAGCPVRAECAEAGMADSQAVGIWGGTSDQQRRLLRRADPDRPMHGPPPDDLADFIAEHEALTWTERLRAWNEAHPERPYRTASALASAWRYVTSARDVA